MQSYLLITQNTTAMFVVLPQYKSVVYINTSFIKARSIDFIKIDSELEYFIIGKPTTVASFINSSDCYYNQAN